MAAIFSEYAHWYDLLNRDKPYRQEALYIDGLLQAHLATGAKPARVLDLACGTGRHCFELERLGYLVEGSDPATAMIAIARQMAEKNGSGVRFHSRSFQKIDRLSNTYDAVLTLFSAIGYLTKPADLLQGLRNINKLLPEGGLLIFDHWNGNAVLRDYEPVRVLRRREGEREVVRISRTSLEPVRQLARVDFEFLCLESGALARRFEERHRVRYFFFQELELLLAAAGFELLARYTFGRRTLSPAAWNIVVVARKHGGAAR